jgi:hypothetical protein
MMHARVLERPTLPSPEQLINKEANAVCADDESNKIGSHHQDNIHDCPYSSHVPVPDLLTELQGTHQVRI